MIIQEFIGKEIDSLDRSIVATPETRERPRLHLQEQIKVLWM